mmetsp:Transcript_32343/g.100064  ORF Transcript_32343/g.100064 Transcript_32343/m.100064 type:complete len:246 (+) Transcript_32343:196-933(+)
MLTASTVDPAVCPKQPANAHPASRSLPATDGSVNYRVQPQSISPRNFTTCACRLKTTGAASVSTRPRCTQATACATGPCSSAWRSTRCRRGRLRTAIRRRDFRFALCSPTPCHVADSPPRLRCVAVNASPFAHRVYAIADDVRSSRRIFDCPPRGRRLSLKSFRFEATRLVRLRYHVVCTAALRLRDIFPICAICPASSLVQRTAILAAPPMSELVLRQHSHVRQKGVRSPSFSSSAVISVHPRR